MDTTPVSYVFLDRDGVLNRKMPEGEYVRAWSQFEWLPGAEEAVGRLNNAGMTTIVVSNQRGIALGLYTEADLETIHFKMLGDLERRGAWLDAIYYCPHEVGACNCRKPDIGLFEQAFEKFPEANSGNSVLIGDSLSDIQAGRRLGMRTVFIQGDANVQKAGNNDGRGLADAVAHSLLEAVETYLKLG
jgi:D-glycero-D-manno-heptose 1,7-bisphosphate phosphatase